MGVECEKVLEDSGIVAHHAFPVIAAFKEPVWLPCHPDLVLDAFVSGEVECIQLVRQKAKCFGITVRALQSHRLW